MALPWLPDGLAFIAEEEVLIRISPKFSASKMEFMSGAYGPFTAGRPVKVPLWLALFLNSSQSCTLIPPKWLNTSSLRKRLEQERNEKDGLAKLSSHYMEESFAFFVRCRENVRDVDRVKELIEDLWNLRVEKLRKAFVGKAQEEAYDLTNATRMELHMFREPMTKIRELFNSLNELRVGLEPAEEK